MQGNVTQYCSFGYYNISKLKIQFAFFIKDRRKNVCHATHHSWQVRVTRKFAVKFDLKRTFLPKNTPFLGNFDTKTPIVNRTNDKIG